jgi:hypothetical protein
VWVTPASTGWQNAVRADHAAGHVRAALPGLLAAIAGS